MRAKNWHGLKRIKIRQSWNKYNLYNISRLRSPVNSAQTYFKQKWVAKSASRAYHGETILEKQWKKMFRPHVQAVIPINAKRLAQSDGSDQAAGRGSGLAQREGSKSVKKRLLPYMNMTYAQTERRLDTAIFRAMFASSTRQARQFVIHGYVKVNSKQMLYPGYQLNPGDMFQVDPERVLYATGHKKLGAMETEANIQDNVETMTDEVSIGPDTEAHDAELDNSGKVETVKSLTVEEELSPKVTLQELMVSAKMALHEVDSPSAKQKRGVRNFQRLVRTALSRKDEASTVVGDIKTQLSELMTKLSLAGERQANSQGSESEMPTSLTAKERLQLEKALAAARENPIDNTKPYATPWAPRDYMSAFAFIPRYLEVHHKICSAVYLRHPVVRPGLAEVPTPFNSEILGLAFNWYLRRR